MNSTQSILCPHFSWVMSQLLAFPFVPVMLSTRQKWCKRNGDEDVCDFLDSTYRTKNLRDHQEK